MARFRTSCVDDKNPEFVDFFRSLQEGCLCEKSDSDFSQTVQSLWYDLPKIHGKTSVLSEKGTETDEHFPITSMKINQAEMDRILLNCGLITTVCAQYERQTNSGKCCSSIKNLVEILLLEAPRCTEYLLSLLACDEPYISFSAMKSLIGLLQVQFIDAKSTELWVHVCQQLTQYLSASDTDSYKFAKILSFFETFATCTERCRKQPPYVVSRENCKTSTYQPVNTMDNLGVRLQQEISHLPMPLFLRTASGWGNCNQKLEALHSILNMLLMFKKNEDLKNTFLEDFTSLMSLMDNTAPLSIWEKVCFVLRDILDYTACITTGTGSLLQRKFDAAQQILRWLRKLKIPDSFGYCHGFAQSYDLNSGQGKSIFPGHVPSHLPLLVLNLACLAMAAMHLCNVSERDMGKHFIDDLLTFQELIREKVNLHSAEVSVASSACMLFLFEDQDDILIEILLYSIEIYNSLQRLPTLNSEYKFVENDQLVRCSIYWDPHEQFHRFVSMIKHDHIVMLDLLISDETNFLLYLMKYLKLLAHFKSAHRSPAEGSGKTNLSDACKQPTKKLVDYEKSSDSSCESDDDAALCATATRERLVCEDLVTLTFRNLCFAIEKQSKKNLFPYNAQPLLKLLKMIS